MNLLPKGLNECIEKVKNNDDIKKLLKTGGLVIAIWLIYKIWRDK